MESISAQELRSVIARQNPAITVIDVREPSEYEEGHIEGAENIPLGDIHKAAHDLADFDAVYLYCRSGGRSALGCQILQGAGVPAVNLEGGYIAWQRLS